MKISRRDFLKASAAGACAVVATGALAACGSSSSSSGGSSSSGSDNSKAISDLVLYETTANEVEDFNVLHTQAAKNARITTNLVSGLCAANAHGVATPAIAESWEMNDDATEWTFHLRDDVCWVNQAGEKMADLTSQDFVCGLEWVLNFYKNEANNSSMVREMVAGAEEYYDQVKEMDSAEGAALA